MLYACYRPSHLILRNCDAGTTFGNYSLLQRKLRLKEVKLTTQVVKLGLEPEHSNTVLCHLYTVFHIF